MKINLYRATLKNAILKKVHHVVQIDTDEILEVSQELEEKHTVLFRPKKGQPKAENIKSKNKGKSTKTIKH